MNRSILAVAMPFIAGAAALQAAPPAPATTGSNPVALCEARWHDAARGRDVPVRIRMPAGAGKVPLVLFSHGLGGNLDAGTAWAEAWAADGNAVINLQHAGSDSAIIGTGGFRAAMSGEQLRSRAGDVRFVLDEVARRPREGACDLRRIDRSRIGMAGHSFGAQTSLGVAGTSYPGGSLADARIRAAIALSPQPAMLQADDRAFGTIHMPFLSITGSADRLHWLNRVTPADRERPFRAMAPGGKYLLVMKGGTHRMFGGQDASPASAGIRAAVIRATTLFWRATLRDDSAARAELDRFGGTLGPGDRFERR